MARQRFIWPEIWKDPIFGRLAPTEQVFFIACFSLADDEGRLLADPAFLRSEMFPYKDYTSKKVKTVRDAVIEQVDSVHLYTAQGQEYIALLRWSEYQKPKYPKPSKIPPPFLQASPKRSEGFPENGAMGWDGLDRDGLDSAGVGANEPAQDSVREERLARLVKVCGEFDDSTRGVIAGYLDGARESDVGAAIEAARGPGVKSPIAVAVSELKKRAQAREVA